MDPSASVTATEVQSAKYLYIKLTNTSPDLAEDFDTKYEAWKKTWSRNNDLPSSNSGPEFASLTALGPKIVPFVVYRLTSDTDFMALHLYNKVEADINYRSEPDELLNPKVVQPPTNLVLAAETIIKINFMRNNDVHDALRSWGELRTERQHYSSSRFFTEGDGYWRLVDIGPSIIALVMLEYYNDRDGWWHELVHELVHGKVSGAPGGFYTDVVFESWKDWFEHREHVDAPKLGYGYHPLDPSH